MTPALSIIVPTSGRPTLTATLASVTPQLEHGDELMVICRTDAPWGHASRNTAMRRATGSHLLFIDDDDRYVDDALALVRGWVEQEPDRVHLYAMRYDYGRVVYPVWPLTCGYVSTQMLCVPNVPHLLGRWGDRYEGDYDFAATTMALRSDEPVVHMDVAVLVGLPAHARAAA